MLQASPLINRTSVLTILRTIHVRLSTTSASTLELATSALKVTTALVELLHLISVLLEHTMMKKGNEFVNLVLRDTFALPGLCPLPTTAAQAGIIVWKTPHLPVSILVARGRTTTRQVSERASNCS